MIRATVVTRGGHRLRAHIRKVSRRSPTSLEVGFFDNKKYPDGTYVAQVAVYNNYGTGNIPARPFFDEFADGSTETLREHSARTPPITNAFLTEVAGILKNYLQSVIRVWTEPPNAPRTIAKKGKDDPLVDTELMLNSVDHRIE